MGIILFAGPIMLITIVVLLITVLVLSVKLAKATKENYAGFGNYGTATSRANRYGLKRDKIDVASHLAPKFGHKRSKSFGKAHDLASELGHSHVLRKIRQRCHGPKGAGPKHRGPTRRVKSPDY